MEPRIFGIGERLVKGQNGADRRHCTLTFDNLLSSYFGYIFGVRPKQTLFWCSTKTEYLKSEAEPQLQFFVINTLLHLVIAKTYVYYPHFFYKRLTSSALICIQRAMSFSIKHFQSLHQNFKNIKICHWRKLLQLL